MQSVFDMSYVATQHVVQCKYFPSYVFTWLLSGHCSDLGSEATSGLNVAGFDQWLHVPVEGVCSSLHHVAYRGRLTPVGSFMHWG